MKSSPNKTPTRFVILFEGRSGSTYLIEALNSHSRIRAEKELLAAIRNRLEAGQTDVQDQLDCIERLYRPGDHDYDVIGFKTKMKDIQDPEGLAGVLRDNGVRVILLRRRNRIKLVVSLLNAMRLNEATGDWNLYREADRQAKLKLEPGLFKEWLEASEKAGLELSNYARSLDLPLLELHYEDILLDNQGAFQRVCDFLGTACEPLEGRTKKNTSDDLREALENFGELKAMFEGTQYEEMFDEVLQPGD